MNATAYRTFTANEESNRDAFITRLVENDCAGCTSDAWGSWTPAERCPVHGVRYEAWWRDLNAQLDRCWPGTWHEGRQG